MEELTEEIHDAVFDVNVKGTFLTVQKALPVERAGEMLEGIAAGLPRKRVAAPDEIAAAVTFLDSSDSSFV